MCRWFNEGAIMADAIELEARIAALELAVMTHILQSGLDNAAYDPRAFAVLRRDAWTSIGAAMCQDCSSDDEERRFTLAYAAALERLGHLLVRLAEPVQEAMDEALSDPGPGQAPPITPGTY
jgi:glycine/D-amino acid oxidase-like deaminating enzyme